MRRTYDWTEIRKRVAEFVKTRPKTSYQDLSVELGIPVSTLHDNVSLGSFKMEVNGTARPQTPAELAAKAGVDLDKFSVKAYNCSVREDEYGDLHWSSRMSLDAVADIPRITPVQVNITNWPSTKLKILPTLSGRRATLILPDIHFGFGPHGDFHDWAILDQVIAYVNKFALSEIVILGDILDLPEFTDKFMQQPEYVRTTQRAVNECASFLAILRAAAGDIPITIIEGNHDFRFSAMLRKYMMPLAGLHQANNESESISIPWLLGLNKLSIQYVGGWPDNVHMVEDVKIIHGDMVGAEPGQTVGKMLQKYGVSTILGHIHRREYAESTVWSDKLGEYKRIFSYSPGCLCRIDGAVPGSATPNNWRQGMGILITDSDGESFVSDIPYSNGRFLL